MRRRDFFKTTGAALSSAALATAMPKISAASNTSTSTTPRDSLLMLAWDSVGHPHARRMMHDKRLPNLTSFLHEPGAHLTPLAPTGASLTIPVWTRDKPGPSGIIQWSVAPWSGPSTTTSSMDSLPGLGGSQVFHTSIPSNGPCNSTDSVPHGSRRNVGISG